MHTNEILKKITQDKIQELKLERAHGYNEGYRQGLRVTLICLVVVALFDAIMIALLYHYGII